MQKALSSRQLKEAVRMEQLMENEILTVAITDMFHRGQDLKKDLRLIQEMAKINERAADAITEKLKQEKDLEITGMKEVLRRDKRGLEAFLGSGYGGSVSFHPIAESSDDRTNRDGGRSSLRCCSCPSRRELLEFPHPKRQAGRPEVRLRTSSLLFTAEPVFSRAGLHVNLHSRRTSRSRKPSGLTIGTLLSQVPRIIDVERKIPFHSSNWNLENQKVATLLF